jgi:hypothetical protein
MRPDDNAKTRSLQVRPSPTRALDLLEVRGRSPALIRSAD